MSTSGLEAKDAKKELTATKASLKKQDEKFKSVCVTLKDGSGYCDVHKSNKDKFSLNSAGAFFIPTTHKSSNYPNL